MAAAATGSSQPTFHKDVLPVLQKNCQSCHRPGEAGPMHFTDYKSTRPWAKAIKQAVQTRKMPPWFADPAHGKFANDRSLAEADIKTLVAWADGGAKEGSPKDAPPAVTFAEGWAIGKPDVVLEMPAAFEVPASGTIDYHYVILPTNFTEDKWVQFAESRPSNRAVCHHIIAFVREPGNPWLKGAKPGVPFAPDHKSERGMGEFLTGYAPGTIPNMLKPGQAKLVKAGSDIVLQLHYTANGKAAQDRAKIGLIFAKEPPRERVITLAAANNEFEIPPGDANYRVDSKIQLHEDSNLILMLPHMHLRGKDFQFRVKFPDGRTETLLNVPRYDFNWQLSYYLAEPLKMPAGTIIECTAHFDNSANNPANPDPKKAIRFGEQSWDEMMIGFFDVAVKADVGMMDLVRPKQPKKGSTGGQ
ncbi:MAG: cytochrome c [Bryobacteraceae bacterium]|nr:cytochrome c [Bryobacteraceae bacterium]